MSRAFVKEADEEQSAGDLPERPLSAHPNYVTPNGLGLLQARVRELRAQRDALSADDEPMARQKLLEVKRDIRYYDAQIDRAQVVESAGQPRDEVHFGATVTIVDESGKRFMFHIVGDDEADVTSGRISWASPLATALIGCRVGDTVRWQRQAGDSEVEVAAISYDGEGQGR